MTAREPLLEVKGLSLAFGGLACIDHLDLVVGEGEIVSVIGPNGAGKTTLFNVITGVYPPDDGDITFEGQSIVGLDPHRIARRGIARTFQTLRLFLNMTVKENVMSAAYGHTKAGVLRSVLRTPGMRREEKEIKRARGGAARASSASGSSAIAGTSPRTASRTRTAAGSRSRARRPRTRSCSCSTSPPRG